MRCVTSVDSPAHLHSYADCSVLLTTGVAKDTLCTIIRQTDMAWSSSSYSLVCVLGMYCNKAKEAGLNEAVGAPGSGKGTLCHKLSQDYGFFHLSVGDYMRELSQDSTFDEQGIIQEYLRQGELLPTQVILPILCKKVQEEKEKGYHHFLVDGFPRQLAQGVEFEKQVRSSPSPTRPNSL